MPYSVSDWAVYFLVMLLPSAAISYLCGCFNGAVIVSKYILRDDVRTHGSGNAGLTNFHRTFGGPLTLVVILCDVLKMVLAVAIGGGWLGSTLFAKYWAGLFCLLGHMFPFMFQFKGGKGILSGGTLTLLIDWRMALVAWGLFLLCVALTRYVSLGSVCAAASFPVSTLLFVSRSTGIVILSILLGGLVVWKHRGNIQRLLKGNESKLTLRRKKE